MPAKPISFPFAARCASRGLFGLVLGLVDGLLLGLVVGLIVGPVSGLVFGLGGRFSGKQLTERLRLSPNEGIHRSLRNGLLLFACGLVLGLVAGLVFGLEAGLLLGLTAAGWHYILRFWLARSGVFPWRAVPFLEDATARILLRRVGGGYSFAHRLLLDFFADASTGASSTSPATQST